MPGSRVLGWPWRLWQRSLLARVVTATLVLSSIVLAAVGIVLVHQVGSGLVRAQRQASLGALDSGLTSARTTFLARQRDVRQDDVARSIANALQAVSGRDPSSGYEVLLLASEPNASGFSQGEPLRADDVPDSLRKLVRDDYVEAYQYVSTPQRYLVVGAPISTSYELYYAFDLQPTQQTLSLVRTRLLAGGVALVVLLALVAGLVARQVVTPVRAAARVAERLAAGRLTERLEVRGADDLAKLATAFNGMAAGLQRQIGQLEELSRVQRRFTADVSHELRTPLTTVRMAADVLHASRSEFPPATARAAELLQSELDRFEALLTDLLEISRYDANVAVLDAEPVDLAGLVRDQAAWVGRVAEERGVRLDLSGVPQEAVLAEVDARRVSRILRNLLANAVEHAEGRPVQIVVAADERTVAVRVRDHGVGLRTADAARVFDRFWRADPARARHSGGTGLGLSIALEDARLHGGWLQAWGAPERGASFRLVLPRHSGDEVTAAPLPLVPADAPVPAS